MFRIKQEPDALDLTNRPQHLLSPTIDHDDEEEEDSLPKVKPNCFLEKSILRLFFSFQKTTYDSGFIDTSDENNNSSILVKQGTNFLPNESKSNNNRKEEREGKKTK